MRSLAEVLLNWSYNVFSATSAWANAVIGGDPGETISSRIGKSIRGGGWAAGVCWPAWARDHFLWAITDDRGANTAWGRTERR